MEITVREANALQFYFMNAGWIDRKNEEVYTVITDFVRRLDSFLKGAQ